MLKGKENIPTENIYFQSKYIEPQNVFKCKVRGRPTLALCSCKAAFYCKREHQQQDWYSIHFSSSNNSSLKTLVIDPLIRTAFLAGGSFVHPVLIDAVYGLFFVDDRIKHKPIHEVVLSDKDESQPKEPKSPENTKKNSKFFDGSFSKANETSEFQSYVSNDLNDSGYFQNFYLLENHKSNSKTQTRGLRILLEERKKERETVLKFMSEARHYEAMQHCKKAMELGQEILGMQIQSQKDVFDFLVDNLFYLKCLLKTDNIELCRMQTQKLWVMVNNFIREETIISEVIEDKIKMQKLKESPEYLEFDERLQNYLHLVSQKGQVVRETGDVMDQPGDGIAKMLFVNIETKKCTLLLAGMANLFYALGDFKMTETAYCKYTRLIENNFGEKSAEVSNCYFLIGVFYLQHRLFKKSMACFRHALEIREAKYGKMHESVSDCYYNLAILYKQLGKRQKALQYLRNVLEIRKELIGDTSLSVGLVYELLGKIYIENKDFKSALQKFQEVYVIRKAIFNSDSHPEIKRIALLLEELHKLIGEEMRENKNAKYKDLLNVVDDQFSKMGIKSPGVGASSASNREEGASSMNNREMAVSSTNNREVGEVATVKKPIKKKAGPPDPALNPIKTDLKSLLTGSSDLFGQKPAEADSGQIKPERPSELSMKMGEKILEKLSANQIVKYNELNDRVLAKKITNPSLNPKEDIVSSEFYQSLEEKTKELFIEANSHILGESKWGKNGRMIEPGSFY